MSSTFGPTKMRPARLHESREPCMFMFKLGCDIVTYLPAICPRASKYPSFSSDPCWREFVDPLAARSTGCPHLVFVSCVPWQKTTCRSSAFAPLLKGGYNETELKTSWASNSPGSNPKWQPLGGTFSFDIKTFLLAITNPGTFFRHQAFFALHRFPDVKQFCVISHLMFGH